MEVFLYRNVSNGADIKKACMQGTFRAENGTVVAVFAKAPLVISLCQLHVACFKAVSNFRAMSSGGRKMITKSLESEILFHLSPSKKISEALKQYGVGSDSDTCLLVLLVPSQGHGQSEDMDTIRTRIQSFVVGERVQDVERGIAESRDMAAIGKLHQCHTDDVTWLTDLVTSRCAAKELI